jgi:hypothetical protein
MADETVTRSSREDPVPLTQQEREPCQLLGLRWRAEAAVLPLSTRRLVAPRVALYRSRPVVPVLRVHRMPVFPVVRAHRVWELQAGAAASQLGERVAERSGLSVLGRQVAGVAGLAEVGQRLSRQMAEAAGRSQARKLVAEAAGLSTLRPLSRQWRLERPVFNGAWARPIQWPLAPALGRIRELGAEVARASTGLAQDLALRALLTALEVRDAVLRGDRPAVARFIADWLGWAPTEGRVEAVSMVLLESGWEEVQATDSSATERAWWEFRARAVQQHRVQRPVWQTQINGRPVALLDQPVRTRGRSELVPLGDLLDDPRALAELAAVERGHQDPRLQWVLGRLRPADRTVVLAYGRGATSWADAAVFCGRLPEDGDKIRCRVRYARRLLEGR